ncbi:MAG: lysine biosynthesis protein LysX [Candidatus Aminicenantia bacterium]
MRKIALFHSTIRKEEKLIIETGKRMGLDIKIIDVRNEILDRRNFFVDFDVALERSVSTVKGNYLISFLESLGVKVVNNSRLARICEDKFITSLHLSKRGVPTPRFALVFGFKEALRVVELFGGFPVVIKPPLGSWGRLIAKVNDNDSLEAIFEHKDVLGTPHHKAIYMQEYIRKPGRDIRAFVVGKEVICAVYRESEHWITNTARGAKTRNCPLKEELIEICRKTTEAIGEGLLAIDIFETEDGLKVNEVNHTMEFRNSEEPTGVSISSAIIEYCLKIADVGE